MKPIGSHLSNENVHSVLGFIQSTYGPHWESTRGTQPFVTISRQTGAGGASLGRELVERLNERDRRAIERSSVPAWTLWDDELVRKVAAEHGLPTSLVEKLEESKPSWVGQFLASLPSLGMEDAPADEYKVYRRVAISVRALAETGRVVIVGLASAFITRNLPHGVHVRLVAPMADRIKTVAAEQDLTDDAAAKAVREKDERRLAFFRRHWPRESLDPDRYTATLNTARLTPEQLIECVAPMVPLGAAVTTTRIPAIA